MASASRPERSSIVAPVVAAVTESVVRVNETVSLKIRWLKKLGYREDKPMKAVERLARGPALWQLMRSSTELRKEACIVLAPERYLEACFETFILMLVVCWVVTLAASPGIIKRNLLKDIIGYNNLCVGFDEPPARYVAEPMMVMMAYFGIRYAMLDATRADIEWREQRLSKFAFTFTKVANIVYAAFLSFWPMLLIITPDVNRDVHTYLFFGMIVCSFLVTAANFFESSRISLKSKVWFTLFTVFTVLLPTMGIIDFSSYDYDRCRDGVAYVGMAGYLAMNETFHTTNCLQTPTISWGFLAFLDYGWFVLLACTIVFLPDSPPLFVTYGLLEGKSQYDTEFSQRHMSRIHRAKSRLSKAVKQSADVGAEVAPLEGGSGATPGSPRRPSHSGFSSDVVSVLKKGLSSLGLVPPPRAASSFAASEATRETEPPTIPPTESV